MALPAEPILASALWTVHQPSNEGAAETQRYSSCGCLAVDDTLSGVLQYGNVCCISAEANSGGRELCVAHLANHLLSSPDASASIIDTALSFDVRNFYKTLLSRLDGKPEAQQTAMAALGRLKIMKVFDFEGLTDSISELRSSLEGMPPDTDAPAPKATIGDSEDEDEMLDSPSPPAELQSATRQRNKTGCAKNMLVIDSISHVAGPMIRNSYAEGHALLISFMRSLAHLTTAHGLLTVLLNDANTKVNVKDESPSIFSTCKVWPALGRSFEYMLDAHLLVNRVSTKMTSGERYQHAPKTQGPANENDVSVVEVLQDRHGSTLGRWVAFTIEDEGAVKGYG